MLAGFIRARVFLLTEFKSEKQVVRELCRAADVTGKEFAAARAGRVLQADVRAKIWAIFGFVLRDAAEEAAPQDEGSAS
jgi:hypothetical protein